MTTREPITLVEIFEDGGDVIRLCESVEGIPLWWNAIPSLERARTKPAKLNFAGLNRSSSSLGVRAAVTITIQDHAHGAQGTFWGKWIAENVDYQNLRVDVIEGTLDASPEIGYSDDFAFDTAAEWDDGAELVDGTIEVDAGQLKLTVGAGDGTRPRFVREIDTIVGNSYRVTVPAVTGTSPRGEVYISTASDGDVGDAITTVADNTLLDETFTATTTKVYATLRAGTGNTAGDTVLCDSFSVLPAVPMRRSSYFFEDIQGPTGKGKVSIKCRDILSRVKEGSPKIPKPTDGTVNTAINSSATSVIVDLPGVPPDFDQYKQFGDTYGGLLFINDEIMRFTGATEGASSITFTGLVRGLYGTTADSHDDETTVQFGHEWIDEEPHIILRDILVNWAGVPEEWIPLDEWEAEADVWLLPYVDMSGAIVDPMDVEDAISELLESIVASIWVDVASQKIRFRATRPITEMIVSITDDDIMLNSQNPEIRIDEQVSGAAAYYNVRNLADDIDDIKNFGNVNVRQGTQIGRPRNRTIFSRWLSSSAQADQTLQTILAASNDLPTYVSFTVGLSKSDLKIGDVARLKTRVIQNVNGSQKSKLYFVVEAQQNHAEQTQSITVRSLGDFLTRVFFWGPDSGVPDYDSANATEKEDNAFWADDDGELDGEPSPYRYG